MAKSDIVGMKDLERSFKQLGKVPQAIATKSARAGANISLKAAKRNAPEDEGNLKRGIILKRERRTKNGKAVFDVMMSPHMNDQFVSVSKDGKRSYYPASQEYGFLTVDGGYVPGYRFLKKSITENSTAIERKILDTAGQAVEKALRG
jgi:hypothetical protein